MQYTRPKPKFSQLYATNLLFYFFDKKIFVKAYYLSLLLTLVCKVESEIQIAARLLSAYNVDKNCHDAADVSNDGIRREEGAIGDYFDGELEGHDENESIFGKA